MGKILMGVIGYGYWGPNLVRNIAMQSDKASVVWIADQNPRRLVQAKKMY
ncbi:gfo/Idh/MocA family oxidoreductase, partial [Candidatus Gottesmanbacteria bacterium]|nr:gfo/Idh/MocA family oxidoreductase [Candidatus Gottesmanbacteria bacterium]